MSNPVFIGLGHYARTGKDSLANFIIGEAALRGIPAVKQPFAWKLKQVCHDLYWWSGLEPPAFYDTPEGEGLREVVLLAIGKSPRQIWIDFGTNAVRKCVYGDTWVRCVLERQYLPGIVVIPDVRFPNEVSALTKRPSLIVKVERPGYGPGENEPAQAVIRYAAWDKIVSCETLRELFSAAVSLVDAASHILSRGEET